jgi:formylglycine-generating enzyme required for sulfatase activity
LRKGLYFILILVDFCFFWYLNHELLLKKVSVMERYNIVSLFGIIGCVVIAWLLSENRKKFSWCCAFCLLAASCARFPSEPEPPEGMVLVNAAGLHFIMGSTTGNEDESPVRKVYFNNDYYMDMYEVTQEKYESVMGLKPSGFVDEPYNPVELITWFDAVLYCNAVSKSAGIDTAYYYSRVEGTPGNNCTNLEGLKINLSAHAFRLPTEAEWEYACRGGSTSDYYWGDAVNADYCWSDANSGKETHPSGDLVPNSFGLFDMSGNVWEWCGDWYAPYDSGKILDIGGTKTGLERVIRGGSWMSFDRSHRSSNRNSGLPLYRSKDLGFRTVLPVL